MRYYLVSLDDGKVLMTNDADVMMDTSLCEDWVVIDTQTQTKVVDQRMQEISVA